MPTFSYKALQSDGKIAEGVLDAAGRPDALRQMETLGLRPVNLAEKSSAGKKGSAAPSSLGNITFDFASKKVSAKELENFTRLLSSLLAAGVTTVEEVLSVTTAKEVESATKNQTGGSAASIAVAA